MKIIKIVLMSIGGIVVAIVGLAFLGSRLNDHYSSSPTASSPPVFAGPDLELLASRGYRSSSSYLSVEGQVKNVSGKPIDRLVAVTTWFTKDDQFIASDSAMVEYQPLLHGQTSPFKTITKRNPEMTRFSVEFKVAGRGTLTTKDLSKK